MSIKGRDGKWHPSVRVERALFCEMKQQFAAMAVHRSVEDLCAEFRQVDFEPYAPVRDQLRILPRAVNRARQAAGLEQVLENALRRRRSPVKPFG